MWVAATAITIMSAGLTFNANIQGREEKLEFLHLREYEL
jgi:hypothetical protein